MKQVYAFWPEQSGVLLFAIGSSSDLKTYYLFLHRENGGVPIYSTDPPPNK